MSKLAHSCDETMEQIERNAERRHEMLEPEDFQPRRNTMNLSHHPLLRQAYDLSVEVDKLPASIEQTEIITKLSKWREEFYAFLKAKSLLHIPPE